MSEAAAPRKFEEALARLEEIVDELEGGEVPLERALELFEEGVALGRACGTRLDEAEKRITLLMQQSDGSVVEAPFEPAAPSAGEAGAAPRGARTAPRRAPAARPRPAASPTPGPASRPAPHDDDDIPF